MELLNNRLTCTSRPAFRAAKIFYLLFWLLKPFYLLQSGSMQIGDICLGISFLLVVFSDELHLRIDKKDVPLLLFVMAVAIINAIYGSIYQDTSFILPILYFIFNFMCVYITRIFLHDDRFIRNWNTVLKFNLFLQLGIFVLDLGGWYYGTRYTGTYNDPNQLGFAVLSTYCLIYCLNRKQHTRHQWVFFLIALFLVFQTSSIGMFLGIALIFVFEQYCRLAVLESSGKKVWYIAYLTLISCLLVYISSYFMLIATGAVKTDISLFQRIAGKISGGSLIDTFIYDRNLIPFVQHPERMIYGSGEGFFSRLGGRTGELHSTWMGILYYYGIIPFCLLLGWIKNNLKKLDWYILPVYICIFAEAFMLINHRQPSFWVLILLGSYLKRKTNTADRQNPPLL